jgi:hypothetical protein
MPRLSDTSPEAERVLVDVFRRMPAERKWLQLGQIFSDARYLHALGVRQQSPHASARQIQESWLRINQGFVILEAIREPRSMDAMLNLDDVRAIARIFDSLAIPYALGGSMASSLHGILRYTHDADITAEPFPGKEIAFAQSFATDWYVSLTMIQAANRLRSSFNVINTSSGFKIDVFIRKDLPFERSAMSRRCSFSPPEDPAVPIILHTPEDVILFKLHWHKLGNLSSNNQLRDVVGVLRIKAGLLDEAYLDHWAADLGVTDLLQQARQEAIL